jgi:2-polyprenyl-3-methyl-5-hydroxy-6-metoxy-1,4-benzoquinol methylase
MTDYFNSLFKYVNDLSSEGFEKSYKYYKYFYKNLLPEDKNIKILDVGCGTGQFLYFLKKEDYKNYFGIDISVEQIAFCKEHGITNVLDIDAFEFLRNKKFNVIVLNDSLANIKKERLFEYLKLIYNSLENNGKLLIKTPNMANPLNLANRYSDITHDIGFTETSLRAALMMAGFKEVIMKGASYPAISFQSFIAKTIEKFVNQILKFLLKIQGHGVYKILDKSIIALALK